MSTIFSKPYKIVWVVVPILLLLCIVRLDKAVDFLLHDTYLVVSILHFGVFLSVILGVIGLVYWLLRDRRLIAWMTATHVVSTIIPIFLFIIITMLSESTVFAGSESDLYIFDEMHWTKAVVLFLICSQLLFFANIMIGLVRGTGIK